jgi:hypothetical protein
MLGDHLTHHLDVALPLGGQPAIPHRALRAILQTQVRLPNPFVPARLTPASSCTGSIWSGRATNAERST